MNKKTSSSIDFVFLDFNQCNKVVWGIFYTSSFLENILILHFVFTDVAKSFFQRFLASLSCHGEVNTDRIYQFIPEKKTNFTVVNIEAGT